MSKAKFKKRPYRPRDKYLDPWAATNTYPPDKITVCKALSISLDVFGEDLSCGSSGGVDHRCVTQILK